GTLRAHLPRGDQPYRGMARLPYAPGAQTRPTRTTAPHTPTQLQGPTPGAPRALRPLEAGRREDAAGGDLPRLPDRRLRSPSLRPGSPPRASVVGPPDHGPHRGRLRPGRGEPALPGRARPAAGARLRRPLRRGAPRRERLGG